MKVLVTGGAGYVGSHTAKALRRAGCEVVVLDNLSRGHEWAVRWGPLEVADVTREGELESVFVRHRFDAVLHFAALAYVGESMREPAAYYHHNVEGTLKLCQAMRRHGVRQLVYSSSCAVYGIPPQQPITEETVPKPVNPYGETKLAAERMLHWLAVCEGLSYVALRYFNAAGCDAEGEAGELHLPETHLIPRTLEVALGARPGLRIHGTDFPTPDGTCRRDFVHVSDLAEAHVLALRYLEGGGASVALNLGSGRPASVLEVVECVERVTKARVAREMGPRRTGDPAELVADSAKARRVLGWEARRSGLEEIVETAYRWYGRMLETAIGA